jgi:hypothetical protein
MGYPSIVVAGAVFPFVDPDQTRAMKIVERFLQLASFEFGEVDMHVVDIDPLVVCLGRVRPDRFVDVALDVGKLAHLSVRTRGRGL